MLRWYEFRHTQSGASVICKGRMEYEARQDAAERLHCDAGEMVCVGHTPFHSRLEQHEREKSAWGR